MKKIIPVALISLFAISTSCRNDAKTLCETYVQDHHDCGPYEQVLSFRKTGMSDGAKCYRMVVQFKDCDDYPYPDVYNVIFDFQIKNGEIVEVNRKGSEEYNPVPSGFPLGEEIAE